MAVEYSAPVAARNGRRRRYITYEKDDGVPAEGYRRLTFMMLDADILAVSPTQRPAGLEQAGLGGKPSR